jgi:hypothetical protein
MNSETSRVLIVGAGRLGQRIAQRVQKKLPLQVVAETRTTEKHADLRNSGFTPRLRSESTSNLSAENVVFAVPPSNCESLESEVQRALSFWSRNGTFLLISSTGVYEEENGGQVTESSPLSQSPRAKSLRLSETIALENGGTVLRLAGLYSHERGPHIAYQKKDSLHARPDGIVNLIHDDDAAELAALILTKRARKMTFLGCDNHPLTRKQILEATFRSNSETFFSTNEGFLGKKCQNHFTRKFLRWTPQWKNFLEWAKHHEQSAS